MMYLNSLNFVTLHLYSNKFVSIDGIFLIEYFNNLNDLKMEI